MKYQIAYLSMHGNSRKLAEAIADCLPRGDTVLTDISSEDPEDAPVYILCFGMNKGRIALPIMELLETLENRCVVLAITCGRNPTQEYRAWIERQLEPFMPYSCDYRGMFLCYGQMPEAVQQWLETNLKKDPKNEKLQQALDDYDDACGHPNQPDFQNVRAFIKEKLQ